MTEDQVVTVAANRLARAGRVTHAAAADIIRAHPPVLALLRTEVEALSPQQLAAELTLDSPTAAEPAAATVEKVEEVEEVEEPKPAAPVAAAAKPPASVP